MSNLNQSTATSRRAELAAFLRAHRARVQPTDIGLPTGMGSRRTPGLRREEVAQLSGVGLTWYTWLEQARDISTSEQVIDALARALQMNPNEHRHLRALAELPTQASPAQRGGLLPRLQRFVDTAEPNIACVHDVHFDYLTWNRPYVLVRHDPGQLPDGRRNLLWWIFTDPASRRLLTAWEAVARALVGQFRTAAGQGYGDPRFTELVSALTEVSPQFTQWWAEYSVRTFSPVTVEINHPDAGRISLELFQFHPVENPELIMVVQVPADDDARRQVDSLLR